MMLETKRPSGLGRPFACLVASSLLVASMMLFPSGAGADSNITIEGIVHCKNRESVTGVWVDLSAGPDGFAERSRWGTKHIQYYEYPVASSSFPSEVRLTVGCGGTESSWGTVNRSRRRVITQVSASSSSTKSVLNVICDGDGTMCSWPTAGKDRISTNRFESGWCTWGAAEKFLSATSGTQVGVNGIFPAIVTGNAGEWDEQASADAGWMIYESKPVPRSIVVFEGDTDLVNDPRGHVGWVERVDVRADGVYLTISEMNWEGFGVWSRRTLKHEAGMSYILAPAPGSS